MSFCARCGSQNSANARFCATCGTQLSAPKAETPVTIFYSYSHKDEELRAALEAHLAALRRSGLIAEWYDRKIIAGQDWDKEINTHLESARLVLFLLSADFLNSNYINDVEVKRALARQASGQAVVIPIILRPVLWKLIPDFARLQALPEGARPVTDWPSLDAAFVSVCEGIVAVVLAHKTQSASSSVPRPSGGLSRSRKRVLDAALPEQVCMGKPSTLLVMLRRTDSSGLRALVEARPAYDIKPEDVDSQALNVKFPVDANGIPQPLTLTAKIESPQFEPPSQSKEITLPPKGDSEARVFLVTPRQAGPLLVNLELYRGPEVIAGCVLRTSGVVELPGGAVGQSVETTALPMEVEEHEELRAAASAGEAGFDTELSMPLPQGSAPPPAPSRAAPPPSAPAPPYSQTRPPRPVPDGAAPTQWPPPPPPAGYDVRDRGAPVAATPPPTPGRNADKPRKLARLRGPTAEPGPVTTGASLPKSAPSARQLPIVPVFGLVVLCAVVLFVLLRHC